MSGQDDVAEIAPAPPSRGPFWADERLRGVLLQALALGLVIAFFAWMAWNAVTALRATNQ